MGPLNAVILLPLALMPALAATASLEPVPTVLTRTAGPLPRQTTPVVPDAPTEFLDACSKCSIRRCLSMWEWVPDIKPDPAYMFDPDEESPWEASNGKVPKRDWPRWRSRFGSRMSRLARPATIPPRPAASSLPPATTSPPLFQVPPPSQATALLNADGPETPYTETFIAYRVVAVSATLTSVELNTSPPEWFTPPPTNEATTHVEMASYTDGPDTMSVELAYPTPMIVLDNVYSIEGSQLKRDSATGEMSCVDFEIDVEVDPKSAIKPGLEVGEVDRADPLGWGYKLVMMDYLCDRGWEFFNVMETPPKVDEIPESLFQECYVTNPYSPHAGGSFSSRWRRVGGG